MKNIEKIKEMMTNFTDDEVADLLESFKRENLKRKNLDMSKGELMIFTDLWKSMYPEDVPVDGVNFTEIQKYEDIIVRNIEKSILAICDYATGNYSIDFGAGKKLRRLKDVLYNNIENYISLKNELIEVINKHAKKGCLKELINNAVKAQKKR